MTEDISNCHQYNDINISDVYDPNHPDADWSGFVSRRSCRKHIESQPNQLAPANDGSNFGPSNNAQTADWSKPARRVVPHRESGAISTNDRAEFSRNDQGDERSSTFSLIGGPISVNSPSTFSPKCWETEAQAAARKRKTELRQLTNNGRSIHVRGRKQRIIEVEDEDRHRVSHETYQQSCTAESTKRPTNESDDPKDLIGFRAKFKSFTDPSFLREIGESVGALMPNVISCSNAPFATDNNLPTDPYKSASGERRKDLLLENFSSVVPGYTGKRTFIS